MPGSLLSEEATLNSLTDQPAQRAIPLTGWSGLVLVFAYSYCVTGVLGLSFGRAAFRPPGCSKKPRSECPLRLFVTCEISHRDSERVTTFLSC